MRGGARNDGALRPIVNLELHVAHGCNLACESCSHYSNQGHKGLLGLDEARQWLSPWGARLDPQIFSLLGGEPAINPQLTEFVALSREYFPRAHLRIVTNGFFLHRHPDLPRALREHGNATLRLSVHHDGPEYREKLEPVYELLGEWQREHGTQLVVYPSVGQWTRRYKGFGSAMEPYDDRQPRSSWVNCTAKVCPQIFEGRIWKCAALAYLGMQHEKYGLSEAWQPYLGYAPLEPGCTDAELAAFFDREEESYCGMCPAKPERFALPSPIPRVTRTA